MPAKYKDLSVTDLYDSQEVEPEAHSSAITKTLCPNCCTIFKNFEQNTMVIQATWRRRPG